MYNNFAASVQIQKSRIFLLLLIFYYFYYRLTTCISWKHEQVSTRNSMWLYNVVKTRTNIITN